MSTNIELATLPSNQYRTACNRDCGDACMLIATVEDGRVTKLSGDPQHPITQGYLCHRTNRFLERQYDPRRVVSPLMRDQDEFRPVSWETALDTIAERMLAIREESGPAALMHYRCGGSMGMMKVVTDYFFEKFGPVTIKSGDICTGAGDAAQLEDFGEEDSHRIEDLLNARTIVLWGKNPHISQIHLLPFLKQAQKNGAKLVLIDPVHHQTAHMADLYVQPRPGGDIGLIAAVARRLLELGHWDAAAAEYCDHVDEFRDTIMSRSVDSWAEMADVSVEQVEAITTAYAQRPATILVGWGMQRRKFGAASIRMLDALAAVSGNLGIPGGGISFYYKRRGAFDDGFYRGGAVAPRTIPEPLLGKGLLAANDPPVRMVWVTAGNPVAMLPDSERVAEALRTRELTVVVDSFITDTAACADIILPTTTMLEEDDLLGAYGHHYLAEMRPVVPAPPQVRSDYEIVQALAPRVGLADEFSDSVEAWKRRMLAGVADQGASLEDLRKQVVCSPRASDVMYPERKFPTPSGKVNLIREIPQEVPLPTAERPLLLMPLSTRKVQGSQWLPGDDDGELPAIIHPDAAAPFQEGQVVRVESQIGAIRVRLKFDAQQRTDILLVPKGGWLSAGRCANSLIPAEVSDAGGCAAYYDTPVRLVSDEHQGSREV